MLFNSYTFGLFFACILVLHYLVPLPWRGRKVVLLLASYLFYAAWNPPLVVLLWASTVVDWVIGWQLSRTTVPWKRRALLLLSLGSNLGLLGFFKYGGFVLEAFIAVAERVGFVYQPSPWEIVLPVGISFYTFQTLSYTIDIYRGEARPWRSFLDYALYVSFFPQLVAGPIVRADDFLPQCVEPRGVDERRFCWGLALLVLGLFQKVVVADGLMAPITELAYDGTIVPDAFSAWTCTFAFATQIYCDFAGYSTAAIGVAMCLGFGLPDNFRFPYAAIGLSDFWRRWHLSLSSWLRDYLYLPLGGNRVGPVRTYANLMVTMVLGGLWHGAAWTFVVWGALHGGYLIIERLGRAALGDAAVLRHPVVRGLLTLLTFLAVCVAWVYFRAPSLERAWSMHSAMFGLTQGQPLNALGTWNLWVAWGGTACLLVLHALLRDRTLEEAVDALPEWLTMGLLAAMVVSIALSPGDARAFIYFQF